jgi:triacylglycerol lipase
MLGKMIKVANDEVHFENDKIVLNKKRHNDQICKTKYPLLMVHGVFFRDFKQGFLNYWGRVPEELRENGATVYYGNQQSAASVAECGAELAERIKAIVAETGCEKVNIIAHSKGGLDSRYAVSKCGVADMVASITTINTPHRGCEFADYLLNMIPTTIQSQVAGTYNFALKRLGDPDPDFLEAVNDLTFAACNARNEEIKDVPGIFYQSYGSHMKKAGGGRFPLNYSFHLVKHFDGDNDGLVGEKSFEWGEHYEYLEPKGSRGISHGDVIDLNRENFDGFDVREFYVQIVHGLKEKGY